MANDLAIRFGFGVQDIKRLESQGSSSDSGNFRELDGGNVYRTWSNLLFF
jgi:hypothetical protein